MSCQHCCFVSINRRLIPLHEPVPNEQLGFRLVGNYVRTMARGTILDHGERLGNDFRTSHGKVVPRDIHVSGGLFKGQFLILGKFSGHHQMW